MRLATLLLAFICACNTQLADVIDPPPDNLHDQLAETSTRLLMTPARSGSIVAERWSSAGWQQGAVELSISDGEIVAHLDDANRLVVETFKVGFDTIDIPASVIGTATQLSDVRLVLESASSVEPSWPDADTLQATTNLDVSLSWSLHTGTSSVPLGVQHLHLPLQLQVTGNGRTASATLGISTTGDVWQWAALVKLRDLELTLQASTVL